MEKSCVNFVECLLDRLYKLCLTYLYFSEIYFNVEFFFFQNFGWSYVFNIFKSKLIFIKCNFSSYNMLLIQHLQKRYVFPEQLTSFCCSNYLYYQIHYFHLKIDNILHFLSNSVDGLKSSKKCIKMFEYFT